MSIFHLSTPANHTLQPPLFRSSERNFESCSPEYVDPLLARLSSIMLRTFNVRDVYLSLPGIPLKELVAMGISPSPQKESLIEALVFARSQKTLSNQKIIVVEDAFTDVLLRNHPVTTSDSPSLRFLAAANISLKEKILGHLCILDSVPHPQFSLSMQALLCEFADTIADIWTERQVLYRELRRDGVHMQQTVIGVLRPPLVKLLDDARQIRQSFLDVTPFAATQSSSSPAFDVLTTLGNHIIHFQRDISYFEFMVSCAIQVVSQAKEHYGMSYSVKQPTSLVNAEANKSLKSQNKQTNEADAKYTYDWVLNDWNRSMEELVHKFGQLSMPVECHMSNNVTNIINTNNSYKDIEDCSFSFMSRNSHTLTVANICKLTAHPDVLFFCLAALVGHFYCCDCHETVHIGISMKPLKTRMPPTLQKAASFNSELLAVNSSSDFSRPDFNGFESTFTAGKRFASTSTNRFKLCIRVGVSAHHKHSQPKRRSLTGNRLMLDPNLSEKSPPAFRMMALAKDKRESIDILTRQYLQGDFRQITDRSFQIIVPVLLMQPPPPPVVFASVSPIEADNKHVGRKIMEYVPPQDSPTIGTASCSTQQTNKTRFQRFLHLFGHSSSSPKNLHANKQRKSNSTSSSTVLVTSNEEDYVDSNDILDLDDLSDVGSRDLEDKLYPIAANLDASNAATDCPVLLKPQPFSYDDNYHHLHRRIKSHDRSSSSLWDSFVDYFFSHSSSPDNSDVHHRHHSIIKQNQNKNYLLHRQSSTSFSSAFSTWASFGSRSSNSSNNSSIYSGHHGGHSWFTPSSSAISTTSHPARVIPSDNADLGG